MEAQGGDWAGPGLGPQVGKGILGLRQGTRDDWLRQEERCRGHSSVVDGEGMRCSGGHYRPAFCRWEH